MRVRQSVMKEFWLSFSFINFNYQFIQICVLGETKLIFWSTSITAKKMGLFGQENKNNI